METSNASARLRAALAAGTAPDPQNIGALVDQCRTEPDFSVREMLTWALLRHPAESTVPLLVGELRSPIAQARSQALHTLSKIGDRSAWPAITRDLLTDPDDEVARAAWRAAVALVPADERAALAEVLATQLGRPGTERSLSRALVALGEVIVPILRRHPSPHAAATEALLRDPDAGFGYAVEDAKRIVALGGSPGADR